MTDRGIDSAPGSEPDDPHGYWLDPAAHDAHGDLITALEELGRDADDGRRTGTAVVMPRRSAVRSRPLLAVAAVALLAVAGFVVASVFGGDDGLAIAASDGVTIVAPDGTAEPGRPGDGLDEGDVLVVDGFVDVGAGRLGPGRYEVRDGELVEFVTSSAAGSPSSVEGRSTGPVVADTTTTGAPTLPATPTTTGRAVGEVPTSTRPTSVPATTGPATSVNPARPGATAETVPSDGAPTDSGVRPGPAPTTQPSRPATSDPAPARPTTTTTVPTPTITTSPRTVSTTTAPASRSAATPPSTSAPSRRGGES